MEDLVRDVAVQIEYKAYDPDEIAARYHHRLTFIHPFPNGNGRHARLATDLLLEKTLKRPPFTWGSASGLPVEQVRKNYTDALQKADAGDYGPLKAFVRS
jgi:fido (protein-threonine AMPylation protein)